MCKKGYRKKYESVDKESVCSFKTVIKKWKLDSCPYRLCETYLQNIGYLQK